MVTDDYASLVVQAEAAVKAVKDPELRRVAFEKVLDDLLASGGKPSKKKAAKNEQPKAASKKARGPLGYARELAEEGFFKKPKTIVQVKAELENRGHHIPLTSLSGPMQTLCQKRVLRRHKAKTTGKKETFNYSEW